MVKSKTNKLTATRAPAAAKAVASPAPMPLDAAATIATFPDSLLIIHHCLDPIPQKTERRSLRIAPRSYANFDYVPYAMGILEQGGQDSILHSGRIAGNLKIYAVLVDPCFIRSSEPLAIRKDSVRSGAVEEMNQRKISLRLFPLGLFCHAATNKTLSPAGYRKT